MDIAIDWNSLTAKSDTLLQQTVLENQWIKKRPWPKQKLFLACPLEEVLFGGAAGGAKSVAMLMAAAQYVEEPGYNALLLRRSLPMLEMPGGLIDISKQWWGASDARWSEQKKNWIFPSGAMIQFGFLDTDNDVYRYQGSEWDFVGFDELTQFLEGMYRYLFSRLRRAVGSRIPSRMRATANPGGVGHEWVKNRFIHGGDGHFIPSRLEDNPALDITEYESKLAKLDVITRAQLRWGDWDVRPDGNLFRRDWFKDMVLDRAQVPAMVKKVRFWDLAATEPDGKNDPDYTAGVLMGLDGMGNFYVLDVLEFRETPAAGDARILAAAKRDGLETEIVIEQEPGSSGKRVIDHFVRNVLAGFSVRGQRSTGDKITRAKPFSAACENGLVHLVRGNWINHFLDRLVGFGMKGLHDDVPDAAAGAHRQLVINDQPWTQDELEEAFNAPAYEYRDMDFQNPDQEI